MSTKPYHSGHDIKSLGLNLASLLIFILPFALFFLPEYKEISVGVAVGSLLLSLLLPPIGWRRPHPYSDDPTNVPYPKKSS